MAGLREHKKEQTRAAIQRAALRLIAEDGYAATTCEQIAAAAEVSPATLFRYFPTKEDIVLQDGYDPLIAAAVVARPAGEPPVVAVRRAFAEALAAIYSGDVEAIRQRTALILSVPALRSRAREQNASLVSHLQLALARRGGPENDGALTLEVAATACAAVVSVAVERWATQGGDLPALVDDAFAALADLTGGTGR
jgi:AcrR family transcriptional regulator